MAEKTMKKNNKKQSQRVRAAKQYVAPSELRAGGEFEYQMPKMVYDELLKGCKGDAQTFLCNYINEEYNLLGTCVRVVAH